MTPERWKRIEELYHQALARERGERELFLCEACAGDEQLHREVQSLLGDTGEADGFLERPALEVAARGYVSTVMLDLTGRKLGRYQVLSRLGRGGMGEVYRARDTRLAREVALKVLSPESVADPERRRRFEQEARAASALNHPNIITIYDISSDRGVDFIAMEFVPGKTLAHLIGRKGLPIGEALRCAVQIADALARAHARGIIHRDLKPTNIMVTEKSRVKVLDFGLAKLTERTGSGEDASNRSVTPMTEEGTILGTLAYMSPEQAQGQPVDARSDIFSFGSVLYEMLTGRRAFQEDNQVSTLAAIIKDEPKPVRELVQEIPSELERLIAHCMRKDPERRFQHMDDVRSLLEELKEESESGRLAAASPVPRRLRRKLVWSLALVGVLGLAVLMFWLLRPGPQAAPLQAVPLTTYPGEECYPSFSPDGNQVAFVWDGERQDNRDIYVKLIGGPEKPLRLTTDSASDLSPAWSPDGRYVAFLREQAGAGHNSSVLLVPAIGGPERLVTELGVPLDAPAGLRTSILRIAPFPLLAWASGGKSLIIADHRSRAEPLGLFVVSVETGEKRRLTSPPAGSIGDGAPAVSPDGRSLIFSRAEGLTVSDFYRLPLTADLRAAGEPQRLTSSKAWNVSPAWLPGGREFVFAKGSWFVGPFSLWRMVVSASGAPRRLTAAGEKSAWPAVSAKGDRLVFSRALSDNNIWRVPLHSDTVAGAPEKFVSSTRDEGIPQYSPDGRKIVFTSDRSGVLEVWVCDADGSSPVQLTSLGVGMTGSPHWSPDGKQIVFDSNASGHFEVYVVRAAGGSPRRLTTDPAGSGVASFSRDGRQIYFASRRSGSEKVWKMPAEGGEPIQVTRGVGTGPSVSPDGTLIYYQKAGQLWSVPVTGGQGVKVLDSVAFLNYAVTERGIYFIPVCGGARCASIQFFDLATRTTTPVVATGESLEVGLTVSPDRKFLLYTQVDQSGSDLMLVENFR